MVNWTHHAKSQLRQIHDYIAKDSPFYARRVSDAMVRRTIGLDEVPRQGRMVQELKEDTVREIPLYSYRIIYEIKSERLIEVLAVIHKRRELQAGEIPREPS